MYRFSLELAGTVAEIHALYESSQDLCKDYITDKPAEFCIVITDEDIEKERLFASIEEPSVNSLEFMALYRKLCTELAQKDTVLIHGSCVSVDGEAYLFCAPSGTGKSTHTRLWRQYLGERAVMINDDKPLVRLFDDCIRIYGTPWNGKHRLGSNISAPLKSICFLNRGSINTIREMDSKDSIPMLLKYTFKPESPTGMLNVLNSVTRIPSFCNFWSLECNMCEGAAKVSYTAMSGN